MSELIRCDKCKIELPREIKGKFLFWNYFSSEGYYSDNELNLHLCKSCFKKFGNWLKK